MSLLDLTAAVIALRETNHADLERLTAELERLAATVAAGREAIDGVLDARLTESARAFRAIQLRLEELAELRLEACLRAMIEVVERLGELSETGATVDLEELRRRLDSLTEPRARLAAALTDAGVVRLDTLGAAYEPRLHEVVRRERVPGCDREWVLEELTAGYRREGADHAFVRARVVVAAPPGVAADE